MAQPGRACGCCSSGATGGVLAVLVPVAALVCAEALASTMAAAAAKGANRGSYRRGPHRPGHALVHVPARREPSSANGPIWNLPAGPHGVDGGRAGDLLLGEPQRLGVERLRDRVHDEPGVGGRLDDVLAQSCASLVNGRCYGRVGGRGR